MVKIIFNLVTKPGMNLEFLQSIGSIIIELRNVKGCIGTDFKQDHNDKDRFSLLLNGDNRKFIEKLLTSKEYNFLEGAIKVLCENPTVEVTIGNKTKHIDPDKKGDISIKKQILSELEHSLDIRD